MPLIRRDPPNTPAAHRNTAPLAHRLTSGARDERWAAARALGQDKGAVTHLAQALAREEASEVREAIFTSLVTIGTAEAGAAVAAMIASEDAQLRTGALDALGAMMDVTRPLLPDLLGSPDADVRLLACELVRLMAPREGTYLLSELLETEEQANVCGAAVDVLSEIGLSSATDVLKLCAVRFANEPYLGFAISDAITRVATRPTRNE